jgi:NAD(P)-dependent dehydrogenase (short-subunit alcohol dehydrogenase family)
VRIDGSVIVVTGASSGIGRATARALAARGARLALLARDPDALADTAAECTSGARPLLLPADVGDPDAVEAAAAAAQDRYGRIDGWVNAAGVEMFGSFLDVPLADIRRVLEVDLLGCVYGTRAALGRMVERGHGVVVNISSLLGIVAQPYGAGYTMAKFGIRALGSCLRQELRLAGIRDVSVCTVLPTAIDTPIWQHAANHTGRRVRALPPPLPPERVAATILRRLARPRGESVVGGLLGRALVVGNRLWPAAAERLVALAVDRWALSRSEPAAVTEGNLRRSAPRPARVRGGWR